MRHLTVAEYGSFIGISSQLVVVRADNQVLAEVPISRLRSIAIAKKGVSISSDALMLLSSRGVKLYVLDWRGLNVSALIGTSHRGTVRLRKHQYEFMSSPRSRELAAKLISAKITNQRAVILYFSKYFKKRGACKPISEAASSRLAETICSISKIRWASRGDDWYSELMGYEGSAARLYWQCLIKEFDLPSDFVGRHGRGATDITNQALNYAYMILMSYVWSALENTGLEVFDGLLHREQPGRPALVLDVIEEYRAWCVDRSIIKIKSQLKASGTLSGNLKKRIGSEVHRSLASKIIYRGKRHKIETVLQRQCYRLAGAVSGDTNYRPVHFKW